MNEWEKVKNGEQKKGKKDHPEKYPTDTESLFDKFVSQRHVDPIPMEDLKKNLRKENKQRKELDEK